MQTKYGCRGELLDILEEDWNGIQEHIRIKKIQAAAFDKEKADINSSVLQVDFAMSYTCETQNEIQAALWHRNSVGLFTAALYQKDLPCQTFLIVTDSQEKYKDEVYCFLDELCDKIKEKDLGDHLTLFTDGPTSEFKNKLCPLL